MGCVSASECGGKPRRVLVDEVGQDAAQFVEVDAAGLQHFGRRRVVEHREQQVLDGDELVLLLPGLDKSHVEGDFQFLRDHVASLTSLPRRKPFPARPAALRGLPTALTLKSPPSCTATDAGACARGR